MVVVVVVSSSSSSSSCSSSSTTTSRSTRHAKTAKGRSRHTSNSTSMNDNKRNSFQASKAASQHLN